MQQLLQQIGERLAGLVFVDAVSLNTGESFFTNGVAGIVPEYSDPPNSASLCPAPPMVITLTPMHASRASRPLCLSPFARGSPCKWHANSRANPPSPAHPCMGLTYLNLAVLARNPSHAHV